MTEEPTNQAFHPKSGFGRTWHVTPTKTQQSVWLFCCGKTGQKAIPFIMQSIQERCSRIMADRAERGNHCPQWIMEELDAEKQAFQDAKNGVPKTPI